MFRKRTLQVFILLAVVLSAMGSATRASAWYCSSYVTVQWGDTLSGIAAYCGVTVEAIRASNPGLGWWVYAGQVLYIPGGSSYYSPVSYSYSSPSYGGTYVVQWGDTLASIASYYGVSVSDLLAANPGVWSPSVIYAGQALNIPSAPLYHTVCAGETLKSIAAWYGTTVYSLQSLNPEIYDVNLIYPGQVIRVR